MAKGCDVVEQPIIFTFKRGFRSITLPTGDFIEVTSCDDGCYITTDDIQGDCDMIALFIGHPVKEVYCDDGTERTGYVLEKCKIVDHTAYENRYKAILIWAVKEPQ